MSGFDMTGNLTGTMSSDKLGVTTTVKEQVEHIEAAVSHFKSAIDMQRKMQSELQIQVKKLTQKTHKDFDSMLKETAERAEQLAELFRNQNSKQEKEFNFMDMQNDGISEDHHQMKEASSDIGGRTGEIEAKVGV